MWKNCLKIILLCCLCTILSGSLNAYASEGELSAKEKYEAMFDKAIGLAEMLMTSPDMLHNKLYTAEQEAELQKLVDSACGYEKTDYAKASMLLSCINNRLEPGSCQELNAWDTLCDGESDWYNSSGKLVGKKKQAGKMEYCYTFYDMCRLAGIPCFILSDGADYITMVYLESKLDTGKEWYFVDVASEDFMFIRREYVYRELAARIGYPDRLVLDYGKSRYYRNSIYLRMLKEDSRPAPRLVYDSDTNRVKGYFPEDSELAVGEQYGYTEAYFGDNGEAPSGLIETKNYSGGKVTTYPSYAVYGVFLRGRVELDGKEYDLQSEYNSTIPYYAVNAVETEPESQEHIAFVNGYKKQLEDKASAIADALLADKNYIWNDVKFDSEEDEKLVRDAVEKALDWDYIEEQDISRVAFENVGIPYVPWEEQDPEQLDKAKAQAILLYIKREIKSVDHGALLPSSASVLKSKEGVCAGISLLFRDMCVLADIPCFRLHCALSMRMGDAYFGDHADNMIKVGDEWLFCDPTNAGLIGKGGCVQLGFIEGYDAVSSVTSNTKGIYIDREAMRKDNYYKWEGNGIVPKDYFEFDDDGKLAIYRRDRWGEPVPHSMLTDRNGRYTLENGLHTTDVLEKTSETEIVTRYAYYYQTLHNLEGKKIIDGTEYDFSTNIFNVGYGYHKLQEMSRRYNIAYLTFQPLEDQPYHQDGVCPVPEIYHGDKKLELGKDFKIVYSDNKKLSTSYLDASYKVEGIGDYFGEAVRHFKVVKADVSNMEVKLSQTSFIWKPYEDPYDLNSYDFYANKPEVEVPGLSSWTDYDVEYHNFGEVGKARVVITGRKNATGSITKEYDILPYQLQEEDIKAEYTETVYNGTVQKPEVAIEGFPKGKYYEVSYEKMADGVWQETEPKEAGGYRIVVQLSENVELIKAGEKVPNTYYISYSIQAKDGSGLEMTLTPANATVTAGETVQLTAKVSPANATNQTVTWTSSNNAWATVDASGLVTTKAAGAGQTVTITATLQGDTGLAKTAIITIQAPKTPETPGTPGTPETPGTPGAPGTPEIPETPGTPENPENPGTPETPEKPTVAVTGITLTPTAKTVAAGGTVRLTASVSPKNATNKAVTWSIAKKDQKYATVNSKTGVVTTRKAGAGKKVVVTATAKDGSKKKGTITITIEKVAVKKIAIKGSKSVKAGKKVKLKVTVTPKNATNTSVTWSIDKKYKKYASVSKTGVVTTKKAGKGKTIKVTATAKDNKKKAVIRIKIKK